MYKYLLALVGVMLIVGAGYFIWQGSLEPDASSQAVDTNNSTPQNTQTASGSGTLAELMSRGGNVECSFTAEGGEMGTVYIAGNQVRADSSGSINGKVMHGTWIQTNGFMYSWNDFISQGSKTPITSAKSAFMLDGKDTSGRVTYSCKPWSVDSSKFVVPTNITFVTTAAQGSVQTQKISPQ